MSLLTAEGLAHEYGPQVVFKGISLQVAAGDRIGMVGPNGEGKTTLLRILAGEIDSSFGRVHYRSGLVTGYLPQDPPAPREVGVRDSMLEVFSGIRRQERELADLEKRVSAGEDTLLEQYGQLQAEFEHAGGYDYNRRIDLVLEGLKFPRGMWVRPLRELSGGERTRACLARLLLTDPDILMLDEPTNHLDLEAVEWLEKWLASFRGAVIVVSHDRYFLDNVTRRTWEVASGGMDAYRGNYSHYLRQRAEKHKARLKLYQKQQEYIARTEEFIRRNFAGQDYKQAQGRKLQLEKFLREEAVEKPRFHDTINLRLPEPTRTGDFVLRIGDLAVGYDQPLVQIGELDVQRSQRIAIVGGNGTGKTTLLRTILGELDALEGKIRLGSRVRFGYLSQTHAELDPEWDAIDAVRDAAPPATAPARVRDLLGSLQISGDDQFKKTAQLSGGQRSRVILARLVMQDANVLLLDEPTNHLDIPSAEIIQKTLQDFAGTVIFVSHDRYLVQCVATHIWVVADGGITVLEGGWERYLVWRDQRAAAFAAEQGRARSADRSADFRRARKAANRQSSLRRRHQQIEERIHALEKELEELNAQISAAGETGDLDKVARLGGEYQSGNQQLEALMSEWESVGAELE